MNATEFLHEVENELGLPADTIKLEQNFRDARYWDSLAEIAFLAMVEEKLGATITPTQLKEQKTINELLDLVKDKLSS